MVSAWEEEIREGIPLLTSPAARSLGIEAVFTERRGGVSSGPYRELNLSFSTGDDARLVQENRSRLARALGTAGIFFARQVHGKAVVREGGGRPGDAVLVERGAAGVLVGDCLPVVLVVKGKAAVVHAGWRGLLAGVLKSALSALGSADLALLGPCIGPCCYEVGEEVASAFERRFPGSVKRRGRAFLDLRGAARRWLKEAGVARVEALPFCTACQEERFFSHRRSRLTGRQAAVAVAGPAVGW